MRGLKWLANLAASAIVASFVSLYAAYVMVNWYAGTFLQTLKLTDDVQKFELSDFLAHFNVQANKLLPEDSSAQTMDELTEPTRTESPGSGGGDASGSMPEEAQASDAAANDAAVPVFGSGGLGGENAAHSRKLLVSAEQLTQKKNSMSGADKMKIFSLLVAKLPQEEMQKISGWMEDGVTEQELTDMNTVMQKYLTNKEYEELTDILQKY